MHPSARDALARHLATAACVLAAAAGVGVLGYDLWLWLPFPRAAPGGAAPVRVEFRLSVSVDPPRAALPAAGSDASGR